MAQRRMFSNKIINSAKFLKMPSSSQLLYFHLGLQADDDGVVEGYNVMRMIGCSEDDLKILVAKGFIIVLNEDLVSFITDWQEHNLIRADRKVDSIYKNLLIQVVSDVKLLESRERTDLKGKSGRPVDNQRTTNGQHSIGKDSIGEDSIVYDNENITPAVALNIIRELCPSLPAIRSMSDSRMKSLKARLKELKGGLEEFKNILIEIEKSDLLMGRIKSDREWKADIDWILNPNNFLKILEGRYINRKQIKTFGGSKDNGFI